MLPDDLSEKPPYTLASAHLTMDVLEREGDRKREQWKVLNRGSFPEA